MTDVASGGLLLANATAQGIPWETVREALFTDIKGMDHIDTLGLIDSCTIPETTEQTSRACQVFAGQRSGAMTLTRRFIEAAHQLQREGSAWTTAEGFIRGDPASEPDVIRRCPRYGLAPDGW